MNVIEAVKLAKEGKKIRCKDWGDKNFIFMKSTVCTSVLYRRIDQIEDKVACFHDWEILSNDWEIYKENNNE